MTQFKLEDIASFIAPQGVDTLKISKLLMQYGFTESQSEALSAIFRQIDLVNYQRLRSKR